MQSPRLSVLVVLLIILSGCTGGGGLDSSSSPSVSELPTTQTPTSTTHTQTGQCSNGNLSANVDPQTLLPKSPNGFERAEEPEPVIIISKEGVETYDSSKLTGSLVGADEAQTNAFAYYVGPNETTHYLSISKWESEEAARNGTENQSFIFATAVDGRIRVTATGENRTYMEDLVTSVSCVGEDNLVKYDFNISFPSELTTTGTASISDVKTKVVTDGDSPVLHTTITGEANGTNLTAHLEHPEGNQVDRVIINEGDLNDEIQTVELRLSTFGAVGGEYTLTIAKSGLRADAIYKERVSVKGADVQIGDVSVESEEQQYIGGYKLTELSLKLVNQGGLPTDIQSIDISVNGDSVPVMLGESLGPGDSKTITETSALNLFTLEEGSNTITISVNNLDGVIAEKSVTVEM